MDRVSLNFLNYYCHPINLYKNKFHDYPKYKKKVMSLEEAIVLLKF